MSLERDFEELRFNSHPFAWRSKKKERKKNLPNEVMLERPLKIQCREIKAQYLFWNFVAITKRYRYQGQMSVPLHKAPARAKSAWLP